MNKTSYHKRLEAVRHKILGEALAFIVNHPDDPARFEPLEALRSNPRVKKRLDPLTNLYALESKTEKTPFDGWLAMLWSGQARIPSPLWAVRMFEKIGDGRLFDDDVQSLDKAFGFRRDGRGKTPEVLKRLIHVQHDALFREVWFLSLLDVKVAAARRMVARRFQQDTSKNYAFFAYRFRLGKHKGFAEYLRQHYGSWRNVNDAVILRAEPSHRAWLATHKDECLKQFPE